jgi:hypothetical protein
MPALLARLIFIAAACLVVALPSRASASSVLVLGLQSVEGDDNLAHHATIGIRIAVRETRGWTLHPGDTTLAQMLLAFSCDDQANEACFERMNSDPANGFRVDLIVFGTMHRTGEGAGLREVVEVGLFDASERRIVSRFEETHTVEELMDVSSRSELGRRWVRRLALGLGSDDAPLPPDHAPLEMAGWSLVGFAGASAIAAMVTGGLTLSMNGDARFNAYRSSWDAMSVSNVCDVAANDLSAEGRYAAGRCSDASTYEILTPVFWTVAALAGAAGVVLVWHPWTSSSYEVSVSLLPFLGRDRGGGSLTINF